MKKVLFLDDNERIIEMYQKSNGICEFAKKFVGHQPSIPDFMAQNPDVKFLKK